MQKLFIYSIILSLLLIGCSEDVKQQTFSINPIKPQLNEEISIEFNSAGTKLSEAKSVDMILYQYDVDLLNTSKIELQKTGVNWVGKFTPAKDTKGIVVIFKSDKTVEDNNSTGFIIKINDASGNPLPEALAGYAVALAQWGSWYAELESDNNKTSKLFEDVFTKNPKVKDSYLKYYLYTLSRIGNDAAMLKISNELASLKKKTTLTENEFEALARYSEILGNKEDASKYETIVMKNFPKSEFAVELEFKNKMDKEEGKELLKNFKKLNKKYADSELNKIAVYRVVKSFIDADEIDSAISVLNNFGNISHPYAFTYSIKKLFVSKKINDALTIANMGVDANRNHLTKINLKKPNYLSEDDWKEELENNLSESLKLLALVQNELFKKEEALASAQEAQSFFKGSDVELNELYASLLNDADKFEEAKRNIEDYLSNNKGSTRMLELLKTAYSNINGSSDGFDEYVSKFASAGRAKLMEKLKGEMINEPAPDFELKDLSGKIVKLSDYKGKIVVIDFWATWCGPCKRSFPAMQEANDKYKNDPNVKFLFINTWERVDDKVNNANLFIKGNGYKLKVLMDVSNEVVSKFKVTGIPTKFIVGQNQNIRFKSVGFAGTNEELVNELTAIIDLLMQ